MKILEYEYSGDQWIFRKVEFQDVNLIVGDSGTGKTRLLNTIFNLGRNVAQKQLGGISTWNLTLGIGEDKYQWTISTVLEDDEFVVDYEQIHLNNKPLLERNKNDFTLNGKSLVQLPKNEMSVSILRDEETIKPLYDGFSRILRRRFFGDDLERNARIQAANYKFLKTISRDKELNELYKADLGLNLRLYVLQTYFKDIYNKIVVLFKESFEYIKEVKIISSEKLEDLDIPISGTPIFCVRERNVDKWIRLDHLSSGMQKALLIITDLYALPKDIIYIIDEYENSLGIGAINILPEILFSEETEKQVFITSHHPYIITKFPVEHWYVAHRKGSEVRFSYGSELITRYGLSAQDKFLQLLNDPYYSEGIE